MCNPTNLDTIKHLFGGITNADLVPGGNRVSALVFATTVCEGATNVEHGIAWKVLDRIVPKNDLGAVLTIFPFGRTKQKTERWKLLIAPMCKPSAWYRTYFG